LERATPRLRALSRGRGGRLSAGQAVEVVRRIRDDLDTRVQQLLAELVPAGT
jgi:hypothetical protein